MYNSLGDTYKTFRRITGLIQFLPVISKHFKYQTISYIVNSYSYISTVSYIIKKFQKMGFKWELSSDVLFTKV